jgi:hypothetical protein
MEFKHINDCWSALEDCKSIEELVKTMGEFPNKFGTWAISGMDSDGLEITNYYYDEQAWADAEESDYFYFEDLMLGHESSFWPYIINAVDADTDGDWDVISSAPTLEAAKQFAHDLVKYVHFRDYEVYKAEVVYRPEDENDPESDEIVYTVEEGEV